MASCIAEACPDCPGTISSGHPGRPSPVRACSRKMQPAYASSRPSSLPLHRVSGTWQPLLLCIRLFLVHFRVCRLLAVLHAVIIVFCNPPRIVAIGQKPIPHYGTCINDGRLIVEGQEPKGPQQDDGPDCQRRQPRGPELAAQLLLELLPSLSLTDSHVSKKDSNLRRIHDKFIQ